MKNKILAIVLAVLVLVSVFSVSVFADDNENGDAPVTLTSTGSTETTEATEATETTTETSATTTTTTTETATTEKTWIEKNTGLVIMLAVIVVGVIVFFIVYFASPKFKEKVNKFWKDYNAEFKKLVWPTKQQLVRNSAVVIVTIIVAGALLALLDLGFSRGFSALKDLVEYIWPAP